MNPWRAIAKPYSGKIIYSCILLLLLPFVAFSQSNPGIYGHIKDITNSPVPNAKISLLKADSSIIVNAYSDSAGYYKMGYVSAEARFIKCELQGYKAEIKIINSSHEIDFQLQGDMSMHLKKVGTVAKAPIVEYKADKTIFNVEKSISSTGGDAIDAIKRAPGVTVTRNDISIAGKSSVAIMIDGRLQQLSGDDLMQMLHSIPSDNISRIEVITSPSSKYDAEGNGGIINLILKKNKEKGLRGSIMVSNEYNMGLNFPTGSTSLNYKKNKINLFANANGGVQGYPYTAYTNTYYPNQYWHQDVKYPYINPYARLQVGGDYQINKKSTIGWMASEGFSWLDNNESVVSSAYNLNNGLDSVIKTSGRTTDKFLGKLTTNLNYELRLDSTGKKINIDLDYFNQKGDKHRDVITENSYPGLSNVTQTSSRVSSLPLTRIMSAKMDVELPFKKVKLNMGLKASDSKNELNNFYELKLGNEYINDTAKTNRFSYHEEIQAAYINANKSYKKLEFSAGLRMEHTRGTGTVTSKTNIVDYTKFFPSAVVQYNVSKSHTVNFTYSRRISRPNYTYLNPFRFYYSPNTYMEGNPKLQPSLNNIFKLGYTYKSNLNVTLFYNNIANYFDRVYISDTGLKTNAASRNNLGNKRVMALEIDYACQPAKWWEFTGNLNGGHVLFDPTGAYGQTKYQAFNWWVEATNNFYLNKKKTFAAELSGFYYSPRQRDVVYWEEMYSVSFGFRYQLWKKNLILSFSGDDIFATSYWLQTNKLNNTKEFSYDGHAYRFSITYKFGNKNIKAKQLKSMEEMQRTGG